MNEEDYLKGQADAQENMADNQAMASRDQAEVRLESLANLHFAYSTPDRDANSTYDTYAKRDHILAFIPKESYMQWVAKLQLYNSLIQDLEYFGYEELARIYNNERLDILDTLRAYQGFERVMQATVRQELHKAKTEPNVGANQMFNIPR